MKWQWLTRAHLLICLFLELIGSTSMFTISGNHLVIQSRMSRTSTFWLTRTEYRLVPYSPACDLRTLGVPYITPQSSLLSVPFTDISLFCDGNNPVSLLCYPFKSLLQHSLGYFRYVRNHICDLACNDPLQYRSR